MPSADGVLFQFRSRFVLQLETDPVPFALIEPLGLMRPVRQIKDGDDSEDYRRQPLENEQPSPAGKTEPVDSQKHSRNRRADQIRNRLRDHEGGECPSAILLAYPMA